MSTLVGAVPAQKGSCTPSWNEDRSIVGKTDGQDTEQLFYHLRKHSPSRHVSLQQKSANRLILEDVMVHQFLSLTLFDLPLRNGYSGDKKNSNLKYRAFR